MTSAKASEIDLSGMKQVAALEIDFPSVAVSKISEQESWRKEVNRPIYHIHKWWATRLGSAFRAITLGALSASTVSIWDEFYKLHDFHNKVVLDPFMGSGTTVGEAVKLGAKAVGCDINPVSTFLVRQALTRVSERDLRIAFQKLESTVACEVRKYYQTRDPKTGILIPVLYYFWVAVLQTPEGESVPLFDKYVFAKDAYAKKKPKAQIICPGCWQIMEERYNSTEIQCPFCHFHFNPQEGPATGQFISTNSGRHKIKDLLPKNGVPPQHRMYAILALRPNGEKVYLSPTKEDVDLYTKASARLASEDLPLPAMRVRPGHNTNQALGYNYTRWIDFFNARQLLCLGLLLRAILEIEDSEVQEQFLCLFSGTLEFNNLFCSYKGEGTGAVRHMFSHHILKPERTPLENSVWGLDKSSGTFSTLFESRLVRAKKYLDQPFELALQEDLFGDSSTSVKVTASRAIDVCQTNSWHELANTRRGVLLLDGDSSKLALPDSCIDAVVTDPPYFDFVHYSELSDFFFAWLSPILKERYSSFNGIDSSHPGEVQDKDPHAFAHLLCGVLTECNRVLKDDGVLAFSFHHSREEGWCAIYEAITNAGFDVVAAHPVHAEMRVASPKNATKEPISLDAILVCRKHSERGLVDSNIRKVIIATNFHASRLTNGGMVISASDKFVIAASQAMIAASAYKMSPHEFSIRLANVREALNEVAIFQLETP